MEGTDDNKLKNKNLRFLLHNAKTFSFFMLLVADINGQKYYHNYATATTFNWNDIDPRKKTVLEWMQKTIAAMSGRGI